MSAIDTFREFQKPQNFSNLENFEKEKHGFNYQCHAKFCEFPTTCIQSKLFPTFLAKCVWSNVSNFLITSSSYRELFIFCPAFQNQNNEILPMRIITETSTLFDFDILYSKSNHSEYFITVIKSGPVKIIRLIYTH